MSVPKLQLALDFISLPLALRMAVLASDPMDIIEIGTPLSKAAGVAAISGIREVCPDKLILADYKTPDVGALEAQMAFDNGADFVTVIGGAALETVRQSVLASKKAGKQTLMELTGVRNIMEQAKEWKDCGVEWMVYHRGWDEEGSGGRLWNEKDFNVISDLTDLGYKITVTGGLDVTNIHLFKDLNVEALVFGRAIHQAVEPLRAAQLIREEVEKYW